LADLISAPTADDISGHLDAYMRQLVNVCWLLASTHLTTLLYDFGGSKVIQQGCQMHTCHVILVAFVLFCAAYCKIYTKQH